jgi:hypothetical protein
VNQPAHGPADGSSSPFGAAVRGVRGHPVPVALAAILVVGLVVLTVVAFGGSGNLPAASGASAGGTADAQAATTVTKGSKWLSGSGAKQLGAVSADAGKVIAALVEAAGRGKRFGADGADAVIPCISDVDGARICAARVVHGDTIRPKL